MADFFRGRQNPHRMTTITPLAGGSQPSCKLLLPALKQDRRTAGVSTRQRFFNRERILSHISFTHLKGWSP